VNKQRRRRRVDTRSVSSVLERFDGNRLEAVEGARVISSVRCPFKGEAPNAVSRARRGKSMSRRDIAPDRAIQFAQVAISPCVVQVGIESEIGSVLPGRAPSLAVCSLHRSAIFPPRHPRLWRRACRLAFVAARLLSHALGHARRISRYFRTSGSWSDGYISAAAAARER